MPCPLCTGTHWLMDDERLGQCTCVTPAALTAAELRGDTAEELHWTAEQYQNLLGDTAKAGDALRGYMRSIGASPHTLKHENPYFDALVDALTICEGYE